VTVKLYRFVKQLFKIFFLIYFHLCSYGNHCPPGALSRRA
jgi:hypothetical protein